MACLVLLDGNNVAFSNFHTHAELKTSDGQATGLIYGFLTSMIKLAKLYPGAVQIVVWDGPGKNWRHEFSKGRYKSNRNTTEGQVMREACYSQVQILYEILKMLKIPQLQIPGLEADDGLGLLSHSWGELFSQVVIRSSDKDFYQLVSKRVSVLRGGVGPKAQKGGDLVTPQYLQDMYGISAELWTTFRALTGDGSDGLQGLGKGVGEVTAKKLVQAGVRLPVSKPPAKILQQKKLAKITVHEQDWARVNENYELSRIATQIEGTRLSAGILSQFLQFYQFYQAQGFKRTFDEVESWAITKALAGLEMESLAGNTQTLLRLY